MLTIIVPVRHQNSVGDWSHVQDLMAQTFRLISAQSSPEWKAVVVAIEGATLPDLPSGLSVVRGDLAYRSLPPVESNREALYDAVRDHKGALIWAGIQAAGPAGHIMVADYENFVSRRLAALVAQHPSAVGWSVDRGYKYDGSAFRQRCPHFSRVCGTSLQVLADLLQPLSNAEVTPEFTRVYIGIQLFLRAQLAERSTPLEPLPFDGALYRVGHPQSSVATRSFRDQLTVHAAVAAPRSAFGVLRRLRRLTSELKDEFFG